MTDHGTNGAGSPIEPTVLDAFERLPREKQLKLLVFLLNVVDFYGDPHTWFGVSLRGDPPCGNVMHDFRSDYDGAWRPGARARLCMYLVAKTLAEGMFK